MIRKLAGIAALAMALMGAGCALTGNAQMQLIGNFPNPAEPVLAYMCTQCGIANACTDHNTAENACVAGLPIQGVAGAAFLSRWCTIHSYPGAGQPVNYLTWAPVAQPPATCNSTPALAPSVSK
jgi:hypothetical protein